MKQFLVLEYDGSNGWKKKGFLHNIPEDVQETEDSEVSLSEDGETMYVEIDVSELLSED